MINKVLLALFSIFLIVGCATTNERVKSVENSSTEKEDVETIGYLKMGVIDYEIIDTANVDEGATLLSMMYLNAAMTTESVFNSTRSAELQKNDDGSGYTRKSLYDRPSKKYIRFVSKDSVNYYSETDFEKMLSTVETPQEESEELIKFEVTKHADSGLEFMGFKCDEVKVLNPKDSTESTIVIYVSNEIPHLVEVNGSLGSYITGAPIKMVIFNGRLKMISGVVEYKEVPSMKEYLEFDPSNYTKLSKEEFDEMVTAERLKNLSSDFPFDF